MTTLSYIIDIILIVKINYNFQVLYKGSIINRNYIITMVLFH